VFIWTPLLGGQALINSNRQPNTNSVFLSGYRQRLLPGSTASDRANTIANSDTRISKLYLYGRPPQPISSPSIGPPPWRLRVEVKLKGKYHAQDNFPIGCYRSSRCRINADAGTACCRGRRLWAEPISRSRRSLPPLWLRSLSRRISRCLPLERLPCRLLARAVGPLPEYALSWPPAQRRLEMIHPSCCVGAPIVTPRPARRSR
jgi:hypothetical protein